MKSCIERRKFLSCAARAAIAAGLAPLMGCGRNNEAAPSTGPPASGGDERMAFKEKLEEMRAMPRDLVEKLLQQKASSYMQRAHHCAQSSFLALRDLFGLPGKEIVKALTPMPGIADTGSTCGALSGSLLILGMVYGRDEHELADWEAYQESLKPSRALCAAFKESYGSLDCHRVQEDTFGRCYRLTDPAELAQFQKDGATEGCTAVVSRAISLAASIILDDPSL